jgi:hypothetical protein
MLVSVPGIIPLSKRAFYFFTARSLILRNPQKAEFISGIFPQSSDCGSDKALVRMIPILNISKALEQ